MVVSDVIIVGGGPAGSSCARELKRHGMQAVILVKEALPRAKPCAGWITPAVLRDLMVHPEEYPFGMLTMRRLVCEISGLRLPFPTRQYSIRRSEFDPWLLERTGVPMFTHHARDIRKEGEWYTIDGAFQCRFIVGAGGTSCPVYAQLFKEARPRASNALIVTLARELPFTDRREASRLWFFEKGFPGYSWYVPKQGGYLAVGIGGKALRMKQKHMSIRKCWRDFSQRIESLSGRSPEGCLPRGYAYYIRHDTGPVMKDNAFIVGDAAGLATVDMGEGIGPAVKSGILAAKAILSGTPYTVKGVGRYSLKDILLPGR